MADELLVGFGPPPADMLQPPHVLARFRSASVGTCCSERFCETGRVFVGEGRATTEYVPDLHPHSDLDTLDTVHDEHPQPPVEVDDRLGMVQMADYFLDQPAVSAFDALVTVTETNGTDRTRFVL